MKLKIKVTPNAKENKVIKKDGFLRIYTTAPAKEGKANQAVIEILSKHLNIAKSRIFIVKGLKSKDKIITVDPRSAQLIHSYNLNTHTYSL